MNFLFGFLFATFGLMAASIYLKQSVSSYWDFVAFSVVFCGTISVLIMTRPKMRVKVLFFYFVTYLLGFKKNKVSFVKRCFKAFVDKKLTDTKGTIEDKIVADGLEMIELGFDKQKVEDILMDRYTAYKKSITAISAWIKRCAKYPPAFGLAGTVLGLIHLMKGISTAADPKETGIRMAVALVATFYGLLLSNLVLNPISEAILEKLKADEELVEIAVKTVLMVKEHYNWLECQETFNSYLIDEKEKINFVSSVFKTEDNADAA